MATEIFLRVTSIAERQQSEKIALLADFVRRILWEHDGGDTASLRYVLSSWDGLGASGGRPAHRSRSKHYRLERWITVKYDTLVPHRQTKEVKSIRYSSYCKGYGESPKRSKVSLVTRVQILDRVSYTKKPLDLRGLIQCANST